MERRLQKVKAVVVHWDAGIVKNSINALKDWMISETDHMYHRFVRQNEVNYGKSTVFRCIHCGAPKYTPEAIRYFGDYCPSWDHSDHPHDNSPNNCTIGICILHDYDDGGFSVETMTTAAKTAAEMLAFYRLGIDALWTHSMICGKEYKHCPKAFVENPTLWEEFRGMVENYL